MKTLLVFAHFGEAQCFLKDLKKASPLFCGKDFDVLITGEGRQNVSELLSIILSKQKYEALINYGVCGGLVSNLEKNL